MNCIKLSIPVKISVILLVIEMVMLTALGFFYSSRFSQEIDNRIAEKMALPGILMNQRALTYDSVKDFRALGDLVQEKVVEAFIFRRDGQVFFAADPDKEGRPYIELLESPEQTVYGKDLQSTRQVAFTGPGGSQFRSSMTPLLAQGEVLGGLYVRISADAIKEKKAKVVWFFCLGALLTIVLTTLIEVVVVHKMFVPRIDHAATVLQKYAGGDFSSRITHTGAADQLGQLMQRVNYLLETIQEYTGKLHALNIAGEAFARTDERDGVFRIAVATVEQELSVRIMTEPDRTPLFTLPVGGGAGNGPKVGFAGSAERPELTSADTSFVHALSGLMESALRRIEAFATLAKAEEKYRYLFESALEGIFRTNSDGKILDANPAMAAMAGFDSVDELIAEVQNVCEWCEDPRGREQLLELMQKEDKIQDHEVNLKRRDGSVYPVSMSARLMRDKHGEIQSIEGRMIDITERRQQEAKKQAQLAAEAAAETRLLLVEDLEKKNKLLQDTLDELKNTQLQLVQSEKMAAVGMTAGGVAHDLNNILAGVVSYPELLLATLPADSEVRKPLELILASGRRAVAVVADLLTLAKGSARAKQHVQLDRLVEEYLHSVEFRQMMRDYPEVQVATEYEAAKCSINCSPVHIQKVIMNLVINAVEAATPFGGTVTLRTRHVGKGDGSYGSGEGFMVLEVHDDGPGIPPESREHIFEPFYTRKIMGKKGTGLGLTVVWNVVREHDGRIELDCDSTGTTFRIFLPATTSPAASCPTEAEEVNLQGQGLILVVDDEPLQRDVAEKMLTTFGYEVAVVPSGEEAVIFVREKKVDLVILDMLMPPGMNGLETYRKIIERHPGQKALIVSGFSESSDVKKAMELGVGGFVKKPYTMAQIATAVKDELERAASGIGVQG